MPTVLSYLDFDHSDADDGHATWDAMACVLPGHLPALWAEVEQVLRWAHTVFPGRCGPVEDGGDWDYDVQYLEAPVDSAPLVYDLRQDRIVPPQWLGGAQRRHTVTLTLGGTAAFAEAFEAAFALG